MDFRTVLLTDELSGERGLVALQIGQGEPLLLLIDLLLRLALDLVVLLRAPRWCWSSYLLIRKSIRSTTKESICRTKMFVRWRCCNGISGCIGRHPITKIKMGGPWLCAMRFGWLPGRSTGIHCVQWQSQASQDSNSRSRLAVNIYSCTCEVRMRMMAISWTVQ